MTATEDTLTASLTTGSLEHYIRSVNQIPMLTQEEERQLAQRLQDHGDIEAARRLVMSHLRFVVSVARKYSGYGLAQSDLIQEGNVGLMKAVKRFDPSRGVRLVTFAAHWIRAEIHEFVLRNWRIVRVATTKAQRKLFFNLRGAKKRLGWMNDEEIREVAETLEVKPEEVVVMERHLSAQDTSYEGAAGAANEESQDAPMRYLRDQSQSPEDELSAEQTERLQKHAVRDALSELDERGRDIIQNRWLQEKKATLRELADRHGISAERVRQIENEAMKKLRQKIAHVFRERNHSLEQA